MKTLKIFLMITAGCLWFMTNSAQDSQPSVKYDVHRQYDQEGNLIYYDSVAVYEYGYEDEDSLSDIWEFGTPNRIDPFRYSFRFPGGPLGYIPGFNFDLVIPDPHDLNQGFEYFFNLDPTDSLKIPIFPEDPGFYRRHILPPFDLSIDVGREIMELQRIMDDFRKTIMEEKNKPDDPFKGPDIIPGDSIESPVIRPSPTNISNSVNI